MKLLVLICLLCCFVASSRIHTKTSSVPFETKLADFKCGSKACQSALYEDIYFHVVVGTSHPSSFPLLVHRVCEVFQKCIHRKRMLIVVHSDREYNEIDYETYRDSILKNGTDISKHQIKLLENAKSYYDTISFLDELDIKYTNWVDDAFTANSKMFTSYKVLQGIEKKYNFIYQTDIDEVPHDEQFRIAMSELAAGDCDAIRYATNAMSYYLYNRFLLIILLLLYLVGFGGIVLLWMAG